MTCIYQRQQIYTSVNHVIIIYAILCLPIGLTSKRMQFAEFSTIAKSLPQLRWNTHKSLILSYSEYLGRFLYKNSPSYYFFAFRFAFFKNKSYFCPRRRNSALTTYIIQILWRNTLTHLPTGASSDCSVRSSARICW